MEKFPAEILIQIGKELKDSNIENILNFRSTCKWIHATITPYAFESIEVHYIPSSFQNLLRICTTSTLSCYIKNLCYRGQVNMAKDRDDWERYIQFPANAQKPPHPELPSDTSEDSMDEYASQVRRWVNQSKPSAYYTPAELDAGFEVYNRMVEGAESFKHTFIDTTNLVLAVMSLPKLKSLRHSTNNCWYGLSSEKTLPTSTLVESHRLTDWEDGQGMEKREIRQTTSTLLSIYAALPKLETLGLSSIFWCVIGEQFPQGIALGAFVHLKELCLEVAVDSSSLPDSSPEEHNRRQNILGQALQSAKMLEDVDLRFMEAPDNDTDPPMRDSTTTILWSRIFGNHTWRNLRKLGVHDIDMEPLFDEFFTRHSQLRILKLENPRMIGKGSWARTLHNMRKVLKLEVFEVQGIFQCEGEELTAAEAQLDDFIEGTKNLDMKCKWSQLSGLNDSGRTLADHIEKWFLKGGVSPFMK